MTRADDLRWLEAAAAVAARGRPLSRPNPAVGAVIVKDGIVIGRGWTRAGGRPHAEAEALAMAGDAARGGTLYVTLEPCAHASERGPSCTSLLLGSGLARVVIGVEDPDPRTAGSGIAALRAAGILADVLPCPAAQASLAGYLVRMMRVRPHVTLKLAMSVDGKIALADGSSRWITGPEARAHCHVERARADAILVGGGTMGRCPPP
jgi:diaminohydroxyphosphoribosylaminopyrimidine deaminase/5-amino-6-(5-phosphoribosylamino)uracil reductase